MEEKSSERGIQVRVNVLVSIEFTYTQTFFLRVTVGLIHRYAYGWYENKCMGKGEMKSMTGKCTQRFAYTFSLIFADDSLLRQRQYTRQLLWFNDY